jgi:hypothetical protein
MHSILAHIYHLAIHPIWRAPAAAFFVALILRLWWIKGRAFTVPLALLAGWLVLLAPAISLSPAKPIDRLPGLALILLLHAWLSPRAAKRAAPLRLPALAILSAWWIAGAPLNGPEIAGCVPVFLGVWAALALASRLATKDAGYATIGAALALGAAISLSGGAPHWAAASCIPACVSLALLGLPDAILPLAFATMLTATLTVLASNRGRFVPVDIAVLAPLLVWLLVPRLLPRLNKAGPALAAGVATIGGVALTVAAIKLLALR